MGHNPYLETQARIEPDVARMDGSVAGGSMAVSLKRIADTLERLEANLTAPALFEMAKALQLMVEKDDG